MNIYETILELFRKKKISPEDLEYFQNSQNEIEMFENMKMTDGWKELSRRMREEVRNKITLKVQDDPAIQTLLKILAQADTKGAKELLQEEINNIIP